ncbi:MAG: phosphatidylinositol mannoside acyltransferase [Corynebacteriales bacterium]|nr:phosphatidylinositol mannoside acyltransferase [Mycobacteriales bacterium]
MKDKLVDWAYGLGWAAVRALPESTARRLFQYGADRAYRRNDRGVQRLRSNLARIRPGDEALVQAAMRSYARYWREAFRLPTLSEKRTVATFHVENEDILRAQAARGKGVVIALPHSGNWDHAGAWACALGFRLTTVAERLKPESLFQRFVAYRESLGMEILPLTGGARPPLEVLAERLRSGGVVVLLADRDLSTRGVEVKFFGDRTKMAPGPAVLALRTGAPLLTVDLWYENESHARIRGPLPVPDESLSFGERVSTISQHIADNFAEGIAAHPADWHMLQRLWLDDLTVRRP